MLPSAQAGVAGRQSRVANVPWHAGNGGRRSPDLNQGSQSTRPPSNATRKYLFPEAMHHVMHGRLVTGLQEAAGPVIRPCYWCCINHVGESAKALFGSGYSGHPSAARLRMTAPFQVTENRRRIDR